MNLAKGLGLVAMVGGLLSGCAVHIVEPVKVAYDYSDRDFYDRPFASSPRYETANIELAPLRQRADGMRRSLAVAAANKNLALPNAAAFSVVTPAIAGAGPSDGGLVVDVPVEPEPR